MHEPTNAETGAPPEIAPAEPVPGTAAWWLARESEPERPRRRRTLTLEAILDASMVLLDTGGAAALTMRSLAGALGCTQASLYRHVRNREELVTLLVDRAVNVASAVPPDSLDWTEQAAWSARLFREQGAGRIVNVTSYTGLHGNVGQANYAAAKAGIIGFTKTVAKEVGRFGVTVNAISPNASTRMVASIPEDKLAELTRQIPLGRFAEPSEMCGTVAFLASDEAAYVTGVVLPVDGGLSM